MSEARNESEKQVKGTVLQYRTLIDLPHGQRVSLLGPTAEELDKQLEAELHDVPDGVPFAYLGSGLSMLQYQAKEGNYWKRYEWEGAIPPQFEFGAVYFHDSKGTYKKVGMDENGKWTWEKIDPDEEAEKRENLVRPPWEDKKYFSKENTEKAEELNEGLNLKGWTTFNRSETLNSEIEIPEGLEMFFVTSLSPTLDSYILYDPERAEVTKNSLIRLDDTERTNMEIKMLNEGWLVEGWGPGGRIYVRTKPEVWNKPESASEPK